MKYDIVITRAAERDLIGAADHIEFVLQNPKAAEDLLAEVETKIRTLTAFPDRYALLDDPVLKTWGVRLLTVKNYLAFYVVSEEAHRVTILRFLHSRRDWAAILKNGFTV